MCPACVVVLGSVVAGAEKAGVSVGTVAVWVGAFGAAVGFWVHRMMKGRFVFPGRGMLFAFLGCGLHGMLLLLQIPPGSPDGDAAKWLLVLPFAFCGGFAAWGGQVGACVVRTMRAETGKRKIPFLGMGMEIAVVAVVGLVVGMVERL